MIQGQDSQNTYGFLVYNFHGNFNPDVLWFLIRYGTVEIRDVGIIRIIRMFENPAPSHEKFTVVSRHHLHQHHTGVNDLLATVCDFSVARDTVTCTFS